MNKPNTIESVQPLSRQYSFKADLRLNAWCFVACAVWLVGFWLRGMDELQRRIQLSALLFAAMGTVLVSAVLSSLSRNEIPLGELSQGLGVGGSFFCLFLLWSAGSVLANRRFR